MLRNVYRTKDDKFLCVSAVGGVAARRILVASKADHLLPEIDAGIIGDKEFLEGRYGMFKNYVRTGTPRWSRKCFT